MADIAAGPPHWARSMQQQIQMPDRQALSLPGSVPQLKATPGVIGRPAPTLGEHTAALLAALQQAPGKPWG